MKQHTDYKKIDDGNSSKNDTPGYNTSNGSNWGRATSNATVGELWREARRLANNYNGKTSTWTNPSINNGGFDFSDTCENTWIFGFNWIKGVGGFFDTFLK